MSVITSEKASNSFSNEETAVASRQTEKVSVVRMMGRGLAYLALLIAGLIALVMIIVPMATGAQTYTVLTSSMAPKYAPGTFMVVKPTPFAELQVGDIITYQIESGKPGVITHRISSIGATQSGERILTTKGDNNTLEDPNPVQAAQVKGKLFYAVPFVGFVANAVGQDRDLILPIIAIAFFGFGALSMVRGALEKKRPQQSARHSL
ncbi:signal peptidase I [Specibacter sp. NPDC057265]|uniref:signal peptidase I n=1 Tax=Specibacter sp. NPDC057265 TaxID=3346075 RepID=UPI00363A86DA